MISSERALILANLPSEKGLTTTYDEENHTSNKYKIDNAIDEAAIKKLLRPDPVKTQENVVKKEEKERPKIAVTPKPQVKR